jgi:hypothetical protein
MSDHPFRDASRQERASGTHPAYTGVQACPLGLEWRVNTVPSLAADLACALDPVSLKKHARNC